MKKLISIGDRVFHGRQGYSELLYSQMILSNPRLDVQFLTYARDDLTYTRVFQEVPQHVIGKAPDYVLLALGYNDIQQECPVRDLKQMVEDTVRLILDKTKASITVINLCCAFFKGDSGKYKKCLEFNRFLQGAAEAEKMVDLIDVDAPVASFLETHRQGTGEQKSLHREGPQLTTLGGLLISKLASERVGEIVSRGQQSGGIGLKADL